MIFKTIRCGLMFSACLSFLAQFGTAGTLTSTYTNVTANTTAYNLTELGTSDWAHWGRDGVQVFNHKQTGGNQISDLQLVGTGPWPAFDGNNQPARKMTWTDGTPVAAATNEQGFRYVTTLNSGYKFTVPASPTERKLYVLVGGFATFGLMQISLSDGSAPVVYEQPSCENKVSGFTWLYEFTYAADSPNQTLTVEYTKFDALPGSGFSSDIWAAWLVGGEPPLAVYLNGPLDGTTYSSPASPVISAVTAGGMGGVSRVDFLANDTLLGTDTAEPYQYTWNNAPVGEHKLTAVVVDGSGNMRTSSPVAITVWGTGGQVQGSFTASPDNTGYDLTALGTLDWMHWGRAANANNLDRKATGAAINNLTNYGTLKAYSTTRMASWSDGTPTATALNDFGVASIEVDTGDYVAFTVPADTTARTLFALVGAEKTQDNVAGELSASLSDFSAPTFISTQETSNQVWALYRVRYQAASADQTLNVKWSKRSGAYSRVYLKAVWLMAGSPPSIAITSPTNGAQVSATSTATITATAAGDGAAITQVEFFVDGNSIGIDTSEPYSANWNVTTGNHVLTARATDSNGYAGDSLPINVTAGNGFLQGTITPNLPAIVTYNLTALGQSDWINWGTAGSPAAYDHKATGGGKISPITPIGTVGAVNNDVRRTTWSDGDPTISRTNDIGYLHVGAIGSGFTFTVPADTQLRRLTILAGGYSTTGRLVASLSDNSAASYTVTRVGTGNYQYIVNILYRAASAGQTLTVTLTKTAGAGSNSVDLKAAWLNDVIDPVPGSLIGSVTTNIPAIVSYNLTELGSVDWINWGTDGVLTAYDHKAAGGSKISPVIPHGTSVGAVNNDVRRTTWTDGAPTPSKTDDIGYVYATSTGHGFTFKVAADTRKRKLNILTGGYATTGQLVAWLSDGSAPEYIMTRNGGANYQNLYTLEYNSATPGQTLTVTLTKSSGSSGASVDLKAAWLSEVIAPLALQAAARDGQLTLTWEGSATLEVAPTPLGPWNAVNPKPASPYSVPTSEPAGFYRLVSP